MPALPIPFVGPSYQLEDQKADTQRLVNMMVTPNEVPGGKSAGYLDSVPGLTLFSAASTDPCPWVPEFAFTSFFGFWEQPFDDLEPPAPAGNALTARNAFMAYLIPTVEVEDFESYSLGYEGMPTASPFTPTPFVLNGVSMTIPMPESSPGVPFYSGGQLPLWYVSNDEIFGRWNTTTGGSKWLEACQTPIQSIVDGNPAVLEFSPSIAFFGAYLTDLGDFTTSVIVIRLIDDNDGFTDYTMPAAVEPFQPSLAFWGFAANTGLLYKRIEFYSVVTATNIDGWGFDDMTWGTKCELLGPP
jgi:hypothetical protein